MQLDKNGKDIMDNFSVRVNARSRESFDLAMKLAFQSHSKACAYKIDPKHGLIFYWTDAAKDSLKLPFDMDAKMATDFAWNWLESIENREEWSKWAGKDCHGSTWYELGFVVTNRAEKGDYNSVLSDFYLLVAVCPLWALVGK